jgi:hypothetical protein
MAKKLEKLRAFVSVRRGEQDKNQKNQDWRKGEKPEPNPGGEVVNRKCHEFVIPRSRAAPQAGSIMPESPPQRATVLRR